MPILHTLALGSIQGCSQRAKLLAPPPPSLMYLFAIGQSRHRYLDKRVETSELLEKTTMNAGRNSCCGLSHLPCSSASSSLLPMLAHPIRTKGKHTEKNYHPMKRTDIEGTESELGSCISPALPPILCLLIAGSTVPVLQRT